MTTDVAAALAMLDAAGQDIACTLDAKDLDERAAAWSVVAAHAIVREAIDGGIRLTFADIDVCGLVDLAIREHECCAFLSFSIGIGTGATTLEIRGLNEALALIEALA